MKLFSACLITGFLSGMALAGDNFPLDSTTLRKLSRGSPHRAEFSNAVSFRLPEGLRFVSEDKLPEFAERLKLALAGDEAGVVIPEESGWYGMIYLIKADPLEGQTDKGNLNKESLMSWLEQFNSDHTPRKAGAGRVHKLGNWTHPPVYDEQKKTLSLGVRMSVDGLDSSSDLMNYKTFIYGPERQIILLQTIAPISAWEKPVARSQKLVDEFTFPTVYPEANERDEAMYFAQLIGGGLLGALVVFVAAKMFIGNTKRTSNSALRRPGLPR